MKEVHDHQIAFHEAGGLFVKQYVLLAGETVPKHMHDYDHISVLGYGTAKLYRDGVPEIISGFQFIHIKAGVSHMIEALTDIGWGCIHIDKE